LLKTKQTQPAQSHLPKQSPQRTEQNQKIETGPAKESELPAQEALSPKEALQSAATPRLSTSALTVGTLAIAFVVVALIAGAAGASAAIMLAAGPRGLAGAVATINLTPEYSPLFLSIKSHLAPIAVTVPFALLWYWAAVIRILALIPFGRYAWSVMGAAAKVVTWAFKHAGSPLGLMIVYLAVLATQIQGGAATSSQPRAVMIQVELALRVVSNV
jgi:hypothetical protein